MSTFSDRYKVVENVSPWIPVPNEVHKQCQESRTERLLTYTIPTSILYKSIAGRYRPVSYPAARYRFIKNAYWDGLQTAYVQIIQNIHTVLPQIFAVCRYILRYL